MPRLSNSSAISDADRVAVPRSMTRESNQVVPSAPGGSEAEPARTARLMATAGVMWASFARITTPLSRTVLTGARPRGSWLAGPSPSITPGASTGDWEGLEPADRAIGGHQRLFGRLRHIFGRDRGDGRGGGAEQPRGGNRREVP